MKRPFRRAATAGFDIEKGVIHRRTDFLNPPLQRAGGRPLPPGGIFLKKPLEKSPIFEQVFLKAVILIFRLFGRREMLNIFGNKKKTPAVFLEKTLTAVLEEGGFLLSFNVKEDEGFQVDIFGEDEGLLKARDGRLLSAFQLYLLRVLQKEFPGESHRIFVDSNGFWEEKQEKLLDLADHLIKKAQETGRPVVFKKPLSPFQRSLVHKKAAQSDGILSRSLGDGEYKTIKLIPDSFENE